MIDTTLISFTHTRNTYSQLDHLHFDRTNMFHDAWCARVETIHSSESHFAFLFKNSLSLADSHFAKMLETPHQSYLIAVPPKKHTFLAFLHRKKDKLNQILFYRNCAPVWNLNMFSFFVWLKLFSI